MMKRFICMTLAVIMFSMAGSVVFAVDTVSTNDDIYSATMDELTSTDINYRATMDEITATDINFEPDSVVVMLTNAKSRELREYTAGDFSEVGATSVTNCTRYSMQKIEQQRAIASTTSSSVHNETSEFYIEEDEFNQILCIRLDKESKANVLRCVDILKQREDVLFAEPNYIDTMCATPNDPMYLSGYQWAINNINLPNAWNITTGSSSVKVGIIDTGIDGTHSELSSRVNSSLSVDFTGGNSPLTDPNGHGTQVAGIIGARANNSDGITGVCWNVSLVSIKAAVFNSESGQYEINGGRFYSAMDYAQTNNIPIINYSYSGTDDDEVRKQKIEQYDGLFVTSSGNDGMNITNDKVYPVCFDTDNMISVASINDDNTLSSFSNYSSTYVDIAAPGTSICSTNTGGGYHTTYGTSLSAPFVTGVAALLKSKYPAMSAETIKYYIERGVDSVTSLSGKVKTGGRLNAYKALNGVKQYTVSYHPHGGTGTMPSTTVIYNNITPLAANQFTKEGRVFDCWHGYWNNKWYYTNGTSKGWYQEGSQPAGYYKYRYEDNSTVSKTCSTNGDNVIMYAQWKYSYTLNFNGGSCTGSMPSIIVDSTVATALPTITFTKDRFVFDHWYAKNSDGEFYYVHQSTPGCYPSNEVPAGSTIKTMSDGETINEYTFQGLNNGDELTLYAYWEPTFGVLGDTNSDGNVTISDATRIQKHLTGLVTMTSDQILLGDVDFSGDVDVKDVTAIQKYAADMLGEYFYN